MTTAEEWDLAVAQEADAATAAAGEDGTTRKELEPIVIDAMQAKIAAGEIERPGLDGDVRRSMDRLDQSRRTNYEEFQYILGALNDETILGQDDPTLDQMAVVGTGRGIRKLNRWLTEYDIDEMVKYRRKKAEEVMNAYWRFADSADNIKAAMRERNARFIGDLFDGPDGQQAAS